MHAGFTENLFYGISTETLNQRPVTCKGSQKISFLQTINEIGPEAPDKKFHGCQRQMTPYPKCETYF